MQFAASKAMTRAWPGLASREPKRNGVTRVLPAGARNSDGLYHLSNSAASPVSASAGVRGKEASDCLWLGVTAVRLCVGSWPSGPRPTGPLADRHHGTAHKPTHGWAAREKKPYEVSPPMCPVRPVHPCGVAHLHHERDGDGVPHEDRRNLPVSRIGEGICSLTLNPKA